MENKTKNNVIKGAAAVAGATAVIGGAAMWEKVLSDREHKKKELEITKLEKEKTKYVKKIGKYEPFDIKNGVATSNDSKLVNILTRAMGVAFNNNDVFSRNKSNVRTFPFIISNNSSIDAATEVELRKYYEVIFAAQVANLINHTVFAAENILDIKDDSRRSVDKVVDKILSTKPNMGDLGTSLQKGLYESVLIEQDGEIISLTEEYANSYGTLDEYINDYKRVINNYNSNPSEKRNLIDQMENIRRERDTTYNLRRKFDRTDFSLKTGEALSDDEIEVEKVIKSFLQGGMARKFDGLEKEEVLTDIRHNELVDFETFMNKYNKGKLIVDNVLTYMDKLNDYHLLLSRGLTILTNNNFSTPSKQLANSDPYYRLLDLNRVDNYDDSATMTMKMFKNSNTHKIKLEMAAALLISTEILPFEFIEYVTKYLDLPMHDITRRSITLKYGDGTARLPFRFMGNNYVMDNKDDLIKFYGAMRPNEIANVEEIARNLTKNQLKANRFTFFDFLRNREKLEQKWIDKHKGIIDKQLATVYAASKGIDNRKKIDSIDSQIKTQSERKHATVHNVVNSILNNKNGDMMFGKSLSLLGAGGTRVHQMIEDRLKNKIVDMFSVKDVDKSLAYFLSDSKENSDFDPTATFRPNLLQTQKLMQSIYNEGFEDVVFTTILTEELIVELTDKVLEESYVYNMSQPTRTVTYKEVTKDPIEYILPAYTKGRALLYGATEIDTDQFRNRKVGEPIWIKVIFSDKINSMKSDITDNDFSTVIGIKSDVHRVSEKDMLKVLKNPSMNSSELASIFKDQRDQSLGLLSKIANENDLKSASLNGILIATVNEATTSISNRPSDDYINNPSLGVKLKKTYNLTTICLVDPIAEEYFVMEENSSSWARLPFSELKASGSGSDLKAIASIIGRGK